MGDRYMDIKPRKPQTAFDFGIAITMPFRSDEGRSFLFRLAGWMTVLLTLVYIGSFILIAPQYGDFLEYSWQNMQSTLGGGAAPDPQLMLDLMVDMAPGYLLMMLGMWVILAAGESAMHRKFLRSEGLGKFPLRFGGDELRTMLAQLGVWVMVFLVYMLGGLVLVLLGGVIAFAIPVLGMVILGIGGLALLCLLVFVPVRLAPAAALSVSRRKAHLLAANKVTKHRFWWLFLAYLVVAVGGYIAIYAIAALLTGIAAGDFGFIMALSGLGSENPRIAFDAAADRFSNPVFLVVGILCMAAYAFVFCIWYLCLAGIGTYAVNWWLAEDPMTQFD